MNSMFFDLLRASIGGQTGLSRSFSSQEWEGVYAGSLLSAKYQLFRHTLRHSGSDFRGAGGWASCLEEEHLA